MDDNWQLEDPCPYPSTDWFISDPTSVFFPEGYISCERPKAAGSAPCEACHCRQSRIRSPSDVKGFHFILCLDATSVKDCTRQLGTFCRENGTTIGRKTLPPLSSPPSRATEMAALMLSPTSLTPTPTPEVPVESINNSNSVPIAVLTTSPTKHGVFTTRLIIVIVVGSIIVLATLVFIYCTLRKDRRREPKTLRVSALDGHTTTFKEPEGDWLTARSPGLASASVSAVSSSAQTQVVNFRGPATQGIFLYRESSPVPPLRRTSTGSPVIMENEVFSTDRSGDSSIAGLEEEAQRNAETLSQITFSSTFLNSPEPKGSQVDSHVGSIKREHRSPVAPMQVLLASSIGSRGSYESHYTARSAVVFETDEDPPSPRV